MLAGLATMATSTANAATRVLEWTLTNGGCPSYRAGWSALRRQYLDAGRSSAALGLASDHDPFAAPDMPGSLSRFSPGANSRALLDRLEQRWDLVKPREAVEYPPAGRLTQPRTPVWIIEQFSDQLCEFACCSAFGIDGRASADP